MFFPLSPTMEIYRWRLQFVHLMEIELRLSDNSFEQSGVMWMKVGQRAYFRRHKSPDGHPCSTCSANTRSAWMRKGA